MKFIKNHSTLIGVFVFLLAGTLGNHKVTDVGYPISFASTVAGLLFLACSGCVYDVLVGKERKSQLLPFFFAGSFVTLFGTLAYILREPGDNLLQLAGMVYLPIICFFCAIVWPFNVAMYKHFKNKYPDKSMFGPFGG